MSASGFDIDVDLSGILGQTEGSMPTVDSRLYELSHGVAGQGDVARRDFSLMLDSRLREIARLARRGTPK